MEATQGFLHGFIGGLRLVLGVKLQCSSVAGKEGRNPGVFVGESPGLNRCAARVLQTKRNDVSIDFCLSDDIGRSSLPRGIDRQADVQFGDLHLKAKVFQTRKIFLDFVERQRPH